MATKAAPPKSLKEKAIEYGRGLIEKSVPPIIKGPEREKRYDKAIDEAVRGRQTTDKYNP